MCKSIAVIAQQEIILETERNIPLERKPADFRNKYLLAFSILGNRENRIRCRKGEEGYGIYQAGTGGKSQRNGLAHIFTKL
jgi:hypothetical protein